MNEINFTDRYHRRQSIVDSVARAAEAWNPSMHPRDDDGKFKGKSGNTNVDKWLDLTNQISKAQGEDRARLNQERAKHRRFMTPAEVQHASSVYQQQQQAGAPKKSQSAPAPSVKTVSVPLGGKPASSGGNSLDNEESSVERELADQGVGGMAGVISSRRADIQRRLKAGENPITIKPPGGQELEVSPELARRLLKKY